MRKNNEASQKAWNNFFKPTVNTLARVNEMAMEADTEDLLVRGATTNILKTISGRKFSSLTAMLGKGLSLGLV